MSGRRVRRSGFSGSPFSTRALICQVKLLEMSFMENRCVVGLGRARYLKATIRAPIASLRLAIFL